MPQTSPDRKRQLKVTTREKQARQEEGGLGGSRTGKALATTGRSQARRDSREQAGKAKASSWRADASRAAAARTKTSPEATRREGTGSQLKILMNTDRNIPGTLKLKAQVREIVTTALKRFTADLTRVEVNLSDVNAAKNRGNDKQCILEARPAGQRAISTTHVGATIEQAVDRAARKMARQLTTLFGKLRSRKGARARRTIAR